MADVFDLWGLDVKPIDDNINHYSFNLVGQDGAGKTSFMTALMNTMGKTFTCGFEDRFKSVPNIKVMQFNKWKEFLEFKKGLKKGLKEGRALPFDCCVIDTIGEAAKMGKEHIMNLNGWTELKGDQYNIVGQSITDEIRELRKLGFIVNFVSHDKSRELTTATGDKYNQTVPDAMNQIKHLVMGDCDFILYLEVVNETDEDGDKKEFRRLWIHGHPMLKLKTALYGMPNYIDYTNVGEGVSKFLAAFNEGVKSTQKMQDDGMDVSNPNSDNNVIVEEKQIITGLNEDTLPDFEEEPEKEPAQEVKEPVKEEVDIEILREQVKKTRDAMLKTMEASAVKDIMRSELGFVQVSKVSDANKLKEFINKHN